MVSGEQIAGVVLAGGQSRRMGGTAKAALTLAGRSLLAHSVGALREQVSHLVVSANTPLDDTFGLSVVADERGDFPGPLGGMLAAMRWCEANAPDVRWLLTAPVDAPFIPRDLVARLVAVGDPNRHRVVAASSRGRTHYVAALWPMSAVADVASAVAEGAAKVQVLQEALGMTQVAFPDVEVAGHMVDPFFNINAPEDFEAAAAVFAAPPRVVGLVGWKNSGKTTLTVKLIEAYVRAGVTVATIKFSHHHVDDAGAANSDTGRHLAAGAAASLLVTPDAWGLVPRLVDGPPPAIAELLGHLPNVDLVLVEGGKGLPLPKIEVRAGAPSEDQPGLAWNDPFVFGIAADNGSMQEPVPVMRRDGLADLMGLINDRARLQLQQTG